MTARINLFSASRALVIRSRPSGTSSRLNQFVARPTAPVSCRGYAESKLPKAEPGQQGMNEESLPHVSEEAAAIAGTTGETGPDLSQGTPVEEAVKGEKETQETLPKVMQQEIKQNSKPSGTRSFSTSSRQSQLEAVHPAGAELMSSAAAPPAVPGFKFDPVQFPIPRESILKYRYHDLVEQITNLLMVDGKKSEAQSRMAAILDHLSTSPPPTYNPARPLLPGTPPPSHLPLNPILYMTLAIDAVAPLIRVQIISGGGSGGSSLQMPRYLPKRARRRIAFEWIMKAASNRKSRAVGKNSYGVKVAEEMIAVVEGRSSVWQKRQEIHKQAIVARSNIGARILGSRKK